VITRRQATSVAAVLLIPLSMWLIDRPVARFAHDRFYDTRVYAVADSLLRLLMPALVLLALAFAALSVWWLMARPLPLWAESALRATAAGMAALGVAVVLKTIIGRSQAVVYITDRVYAFRPMEFANAYEAFPSAAMAATSALLAGLALQQPSRRMAGVVVVAVVATCLVLTNGHWVSDLIGGVVLGVVVGRAANPA